jgi:hypothetical protein
MSFTINKIYISNEMEKHEKGETDVILTMRNGAKYYASFFSYDHLESLREEHIKSGAFLNGTYFWSKRMVFVEDCSRETIEKVVLDLVEEGELQEAFQKL